MRAFLNLQSGRTTDAGAKAALQAASQRIGVVGEMHAMLYRDGALGSLDLGAYLRELCRALVASMVADPERIRLKAECESLQIDMDRAILIGIIVSELVTNSLKYAFPDGRPGQVLVVLERGQGEFARLTVTDTGCGLAHEASEGFGLRIVRMLARQLSAELSLSCPNGMRAELEFTLHRQAAAA